MSVSIWHEERLVQLICANWVDKRGNTRTTFFRQWYRHHCREKVVQVFFCFILTSTAHRLLFIADEKLLRLWGKKCAHLLSESVALWLLERPSKTESFSFYNVNYERSHLAYFVVSIYEFCVLLCGESPRWMILVCADSKEKVFLFFFFFFLKFKKLSLDKSNQWG